jgi:hypothetical protein
MTTGVPDGILRIGLQESRVPYVKAAVVKSTGDEARR